MKRSIGLISYTGGREQGFDTLEFSLLVFLYPFRPLP